MTPGILSPLSAKAMERRDRPHFVYELWGNRNYIYVGSTANLGQRLTSHQAKEWWPDVRRVVSHWYVDKYTALAAERDLIQEHSPEHNVLGVL